MRRPFRYDFFEPIFFRSHRRTCENKTRGKSIPVRIPTTLWLINAMRHKSHVAILAVVAAACCIIPEYKGGEIGHRHRWMGCDDDDDDDGPGASSSYASLSPRSVLDVGADHYCVDVVENKDIDVPGNVEGNQDGGGLFEEIVGMDPEDIFNDLNDTEDNDNNGWEWGGGVLRTQ